jgi:DNA-binding winged helix-turn-helix (wHTH) protein/tetratricopeptide (TPR) repeat protein
VEAAIYSFGAFELDEALYQLRHAAAVVKLEPRVFDVLLYLVRHRDRVVSKDELLNEVWHGQAVSESVLPTNVAAARRALRGDTAGRVAIQTVHGRGYRFVAAVEVRRPGTEAEPGEEKGAPLPITRAFVGRESAMQTLRAALLEATAGRGRLVLLVGEPGIGKTRTAEELAREARAQGVRVLTGRCYEGEGAPAFWPWVQVLRECVRGRSAGELAVLLGAGAADVAELVPELREQLPEQAPTATGDPDRARFRLFESVVCFLERQSRDAPTVLILDDLHWADKPSLLLLRFLARELSGARLLVLGAYRDVEITRKHPLGRVLADLGRDPRCERVLLRGLERAGVEQLVRGAGQEPSARWVDALYEMTEGNPFYLGELVELAASSGEGQALGEGTHRMALPQGVRDAIGRRLDGLSEACNRALSVASVLGREFRLRALEGAAEIAAEPLLELLDEAVSARLLAEAPGRVGEYCFTHLLIRETLYGELTTPERVRLHRRVAEVLEATYETERDAHVAELAHHLFQAAPGGDVERAVEVSLQAAKQAMRLLAYEEAAAHYERALLTLDLAPRVDETRRCEILLSLADAQGWALDFERSRRTAEQAFEVARGLDRSDLLGQAALSISGRFDFGPLTDAGSAHLEEALQALGDEDPALRCRLLARLATAHPYRYMVERRDALARQSVDLARELGDPNALLNALSALSYPGLLGPDTDQERLAVADETEALAHRTGRREMLLRAHEDRMRSYLAFGDLAAADREVEASRRLSSELRDATSYYFSSFYRVARLIGDGRFEEAEPAIRECLEEGRRIARYDDRYTATAVGIFFLHVFQVLRLKGEISRVGGEMPDIMPLAAFPGPIFECADAYLGYFAGRNERARAIYDQVAESGFENIAQDEWFLTELGLLTELASLFGDAQGASVLYDLLRPYAEYNLTNPLLRVYDGSVQRFLGLLAATRGRPDEAIGHFEAAAARNAAMGARPALAWTHFGHAGALLARGGPGDREEAEKLLDRCLEQANEMGMNGLAERARARQSGGLKTGSS